ncbi:DNA topoisomerase IV subunit A [Rubrimonas cliftonensis]|uniref:DNA topoisomerase 4 subunit A n=1 Tax=Rubrimonas cliftonensis TaxID=89524 RepID=A0A1H4CJP6_9RHOB|nr:DNA topoisomerase IV subunit A [Rubrimonas cliftonensis]SEA60574.1 DNA topoisomerase IV subunit A [Rubrimonas cliftonensis]
MTDTPDLPDILHEPLSRALGERYLQYALSTIMHRALPDARDGLKPVHRRVLFAMRQLRLDPGSGFKKSARVVGDVIGKFHPHGELSVYDALVRAAQDFSLRYPLIDGQGNFGNIDGDNAAAQRYTEARLTAVAAAMLDGLDADAVDMRPTYDGSEEEPVVLPAAFPNLLANGASGIAVGMATSIPPHNAGELCAALLMLLDNPEAGDDALALKVQGPDFPTGGVLVEPPEAIAQAYATGRGGFRLRARWQVEDLGRGVYQIVVTEIPYQVQKSKLVERLAELVTTRKVPLLADVRDESAEDVRLVLEPRARTVDAAVLMETLFRLSDLELRFPLNMNALIDGRTPKVCSLKELLRAYLDHRREVLRRRSRHRLAKIMARLEVLDGYIIAFLNLDRVIEIIRTEDEPKPVMMAEFGLTDVQAEAVLNLRLRALRRLEEMALRRERDELTAERGALEALLGSDEAQWRAIADEIRETDRRFGRDAPGGARRTALAEAPSVEAASPEAMIDREPVTVICSQNGWIRALRGHQPLDAEQKFRDGDGPRFALHAETTDKLLALSASGRVFTLSAHLLPGGRGMGEPLRLIVDLAQDDDIVALVKHQPGEKRLLASSAGDGFVAAEVDLVAQTRAGRQALNLGPGATARVFAPVAGDAVAVVGENRRLLVFALEELPEMTRGKGVRLQKYKDAALSDAVVIDMAAGLSWKENGGRTRTVAGDDLAEYVGKRGSAGRMAPRGFPRDNRFG